MTKNDEIRRDGAKTEYRPHKDDVSGGREKSVQSEARGAEGSSDLQNTGATSGGAAGRFSTLDHTASPQRSGGPSSDEEPQPAGNRGNLTK